MRDILYKLVAPQKCDAGAELSPDQMHVQADLYNSPSRNSGGTTLGVYGWKPDSHPASDTRGLDPRGADGSDAAPIIRFGSER